MDFFRIGEKLVSYQKIEKNVVEILKLRSGGMSQTDTAHELGLDRTLVNRLESMGEIRKGRKLGAFGFSVKNKKEISELLKAEGVDFVFLMTEAERWQFVKEKSGLELHNTLMELIALCHTFDNLIVIGSNSRIKNVEAVLGKDVIGFEIGESPIREDKYVEPGEILKLVGAVKQ